MNNITRRGLFGLVVGLFFVKPYNTLAKFTVHVDALNKTIETLRDENDLLKAEVQALLCTVPFGYKRVERSVVVKLNSSYQCTITVYEQLELVV